MPKNKIIPTKGPWKKNEDDLLRKLVLEYGPKNWSFIATKMHDQDIFRLGKQCRERWYNHLSPEVRKDPWTEEEDRIIIEAHSELGSKWTTIANMLGNGRTPNSIKNRWNSTLKRLLTTGDISKKRRARSSNPAVKRKFSELDENSSDVSLSPHKKRRIFIDDDLEPSPRFHDSYPPIISTLNTNESNLIMNQTQKNREHLRFSTGDPIFPKEFNPNEVNENLYIHPCCDHINYDIPNEPITTPQFEAWNHYMSHCLVPNRTFIYGYGDQYIPNGLNEIWEENEYDSSPIDNVLRRNHINTWREYNQDSLQWH
jgi:hypothetical protein